MEVFSIVSMDDNKVDVKVEGPIGEIAINLLAAYMNVHDVQEVIDEFITLLLITQKPIDENDFKPCLS